jgi:hypothetical protein
VETDVEVVQTQVCRSKDEVLTEASSGKARWIEKGWARWFLTESSRFTARV